MSLSWTPELWPRCSRCRDGSRSVEAEHDQHTHTRTPRGIHLMHFLTKKNHDIFLSNSNTFPTTQHKTGFQPSSPPPPHPPPPKTTTTGSPLKFNSFLILLPPPLQHKTGIQPSSTTFVHTAKAFRGPAVVDVPPCCSRDML